MNINYKDAEERKHFIKSIISFYENNEYITKHTIKYAFDMNETMAKSLIALLNRADLIYDNESANLVLEKVVRSYGINAYRKILFGELTEEILKSNMKKRGYLKKNSEHIVTIIIGLQDMLREKEVAYTEMNNLEKKIMSLNSRINTLDKEIESLRFQFDTEYDWNLEDLISKIK